MTRKSKRELRKEIDALYEKTPTDEGAVDVEILGRLYGHFAQSREKVREAAADHGVPPEELLEAYERHREDEGYATPE